MRKKYIYLFVLVLSLVSFTANAQYCTPTFSNGCGSGSGDDIEGVFIEHEGSSILSHDGTGCSSGSYGDFTGDASLEVELEAGETYDIEITTNYGFTSEYQKVWIDFDEDEEFDDDDELLFTASSGASNTSPSEGTITIPDDIAGIITTRLRVVSRYGSVPDEACEPGGSYGETHDYTVIIVGENEDCFSPENLTLDDFSGGDAEISWDDAPDETSGYNWALMIGDDDPDVDTPDQDGNTSDTDITLTGLDDNTYYTFYVQADCDPDGESVWREISFYEVSEGAVCEEAIAIGSTLPYTDSGNTGDYLNEYGGDLGEECVLSEPYLDGYEVVYSYTADADMLIDVLLSDLDGSDASILIYEDCDDIGEACTTGEMNEGSSGDFGVEEFLVSDGTEYYIVISSSDDPETIEYTLGVDESDIDCDDYSSPPEGDELQYFEIGSGDTVADLVVEGPNLTWYSDEDGTDDISDSTTLVDGDTYYVSQTFNGCESDLLAIEAEEYDCDTLEITDTTGDTVTCLGTMTLEAETSGNGTKTYWYDAETDGEMIGVGDTFETPELTNTTSYWAAEVLILGETTHEDLGMQDYDYGFGSTLTNRGVVFEAEESFTIVDVEVFSSSSGGSIDVALYDDSGNELESTTATIPGGGSTASPVPYTIPLNFVVPGPGEYRLLRTSGSVSMMYEFNTASYPYSLDTAGEMIGGATSTTADPNTSYMYLFYNWTISTGEAVCESERVEAVAEVTADGDIEVDELPYNTQDDTSVYGNSFSGVPGSSCGTSDDYLSGDDVVYLYTPDEDDIINIELSDLSSDATGVFVYGSCGEIGDECIAGATVEEDGTGTLIEELYLTGGENYFIVISSSDGESVSYTLDIEGFECDESETPTGEDEQYYVAGSTIEDLTIETNQFNEETIWYEDEAGTTPISETEELEDGETYYVSQTILGCESGLLEITVFELDCNELEIVSTTDGIACETGPVLLEAEASGIGSEIYWYDAETDGNIVGIGAEFETPAITTTTSYWAEEVFIQGEEIVDQQAKPAPTLTTTTSLSGYGLVFDVTTPFTLVSVDVYPTTGGTMDIELRDGDNEVLQTVSGINVPSGDGDTPHTITLNISIPTGDGLRLIKSSTGSPTMIRESSGNTFPYVIGTAGEVTGGVLNSGSPLTSYYWFYNWAITEGEVECESPRVEAIAEINEDETIAPTGDAEQSLCEGATLSDIDVSGDAIIWYPQEDGGEAFEEDVTLQNGQTYYASQTVGACESIERLAVLVTVIEASELPEGDFNQTYSEGETVADLEVDGENLIWYADEEGTEVIENPEEIVLEDQETYYVSQTTGDNCQSELLPVTVHQELNTSHPAFEALTYYPNPMKEVLTISNTSRIEAVTLYNLLGQKVMSKQLNVQETTVDVSGLASGTYLLEVTIEGTKGIFKLIKE